MLQIAFIRDNQELVVETLKKKNFKAGPVVKKIVQIDEKCRAAQAACDNASSQAKKLSKDINDLTRNGEDKKAEILKSKATQLRKEITKTTTKVKNLKIKLEENLYLLPNLPADIVPKGKTPEENVTIFEEGSLPILHSGAKPHWELIKKYDIIDFELGTKLTAPGFPVYKGKGAKLQRALISYFLDTNIDAGYNEFQVPHLVNEDSARGTGQLPDKEGQMYHDEKDNLYLIPTAEVPLTNIFRDTILKENDLPVMCTGYTPCFRREAGSWGANVRGLNRLHQFDKIEIVRIESAENSYAALDIMVEHVKNIMRELKLPFRILRLCGGDMSFASALTYDFEVYSAAQKRWLEISSVSNFETFQSNRLKLRYKDKDGKTKLAHTLNGSSLALPRVLAGILENYQTPEGIVIPEVLRPYTGFDIIN